MGYWERINSTEDLKRLSKRELKIYSQEIRQHIIDSVNQRGGHLASNLGVIELTLALHYVFSSPKDKIVFDVGHQCYTHKIVTGRRDRFADIRTNGGISGFPSVSESEHDCFGVGHSSTSLSVGMGLSHARDLLGKEHNVVCVIGDGALTGGMAFEALNDIGAQQKKILIVLNDNKMSISGNVGALSKYLTKLRLSKRYTGIKRNIKKGISAIPIFGDRLVRVIDKSKDSIKSMLLFNKIFESLGLKYYGPIDGHNIDEMIDVFNQLKNEKRPSIIHLITNKGSGHKAAESNPLKYHGVNSKEDKKIIETNFSNILGNFLISARERNDKVVAITAAMAAGTGLTDYAVRYPNSYFDVAIAEQHAVTMAAGMAAGGLIPYVAIYSTFLQRAFDQIIHDVCIDGHAVRFVIDRAGMVGADGKTHQGIFDLSYLGMIPNMTICSPKDGNEFHSMLEWSLDYNHPLAIRYPKSYDQNFNTGHKIELGKWEVLKESKARVYILATGSRMVSMASTIENANVINAMFVKPLDKAVLDRINKKDNLIITMEDNIRRGGFGESILSFYGKNLKCRLEILAHGDEFCDNRDIVESLSASNLTREYIQKIIKEN